jgi:uncharacterized protein
MFEDPIIDEVRKTRERLAEKYNFDVGAIFKEGVCMNKQKLIEMIKANRDLLEEFSVKSVSIFGSVARDEDRSDSDIDILVEFDPDARIGFFAFARLQRRLSDIIGRPVDLVTPDALHKEMKNRILEAFLSVIPVKASLSSFRRKTESRQNPIKCSPVPNFEPLSR